MAAPRRVIDISIEDEDLAQLETIARSWTAPANWVERARILLAYRADPSSYAVGEAVGVTHQTVLRCLDRAVRLGVVTALDDSPRPGKPGARLVIDRLPPAETLIGDRGYDSNGFRVALAECGITACIPPTKSRKQPIDYDKALYKQRHKIENMFAKLKDWRRIAMRYDRCAHTFFSAICLAAAVMFYL